MKTFASILASITLKHKEDRNVVGLKQSIIEELGPYVNQEIDYKEFVAFFSNFQRQNTTYGVLKCCVDTVAELQSTLTVDQEKVIKHRSRR